MFNFQNLLFGGTEPVRELPRVTARDRASRYERALLAIERTAMPEDMRRIAHEALGHGPCAHADNVAGFVP